MPNFHQSRTPKCSHVLKPVTDGDLELLHAATRIDDLTQFVADTEDLRSCPGKEKAYKIILDKIKAWHNATIPHDIIAHSIHRRKDNFADHYQFKKELDREKREQK